MLTPKQEKFVDVYVNTGNATEAVIQAGYNCKDRLVARNIGSENLAKPVIREALQVKQAEIAEILKDEAITILNNLLEIAYDENVNPAVRVKALTDLLDRAGYSAKNNLTISGGDPIVLETRQTLEVAQRARELMIEKLKVRA